MNLLSISEVEAYIHENIGTQYHAKKLAKIERLTLTSLKPEEAKAFDWLIPYASALDPKRGFFTFTRPDNFDSPIGKCLGANGINTVITRMQNALVAAGYTTSRVLAQQQDLKSGTLNLHLMLGRIKDIKYTS